MFFACSIRISRGRRHWRHHPSVRFPTDAAPIRSLPTSPSVRHREHLGHEMIQVASVIFGMGGVVGVTMAYAYCGPFTIFGHITRAISLPHPFRSGVTIFTPELLPPPVLGSVPIGVRVHRSFASHAQRTC